MIRILSATLLASLCVPAFAQAPKPVERVLPGIQKGGFIQLPNQWKLNPVGQQVEVGDLPVDIRDHAPRWRVWFFAGLILGGLISATFAQTWATQASLDGLGDFLKLGEAGQIAALAVDHCRRHSGRHL